jgi:hypothetical protein
MKVLFITKLFHIRLPGALGRGIRLPFGLILTNDRDQIRKLLSENFELLAGQLETSALREANAAIYRITEHPQGSLQKEDEVRRFLNGQLGRVQMFLQALWLVKDNSIKCRAWLSRVSARQSTRLNSSYEQFSGGSFF